MADHAAKLRSRSRFAQLALYASAAASALGPIQLLLGRAARATPEGDGLAVIQFFLFALSAVLWCRWHGAVHRALQARSLSLQFGARAWAWMFVPVASLYKPYQAVRELYRQATGRLKGPDVMQVWWAAWVFANILSPRDLFTEHDYNARDATSDALFSVAGIAAGYLIRTITNAALTSYSSRMEAREQFAATFENPYVS